MSNNKPQNQRPASQDERLVRQTGEAPAESRASRESADDARENEDGTALTMAERKQLLRREWEADLLPEVKDSKGYWHYCWLSTTNNTDPIYRRLKVGYELVKFATVSLLGVQNQITSGEFAGCVSINEMILARIPNELYQEMMKINHHERPMGEEELLKANALRDDEDSEGNSLGQLIGDGIKKLGTSRRAPTFED